jgi:hypothetical protein
VSRGDSPVGGNSYGVRTTATSAIAVPPGVERRRGLRGAGSVAAVGLATTAAGCTEVVDDADGLDTAPPATATTSASTGSPCGRAARAPSVCCSVPSGRLCGLRLGRPARPAAAVRRLHVAGVPAVGLGFAALAQAPLALSAFWLADGMPGTESPAARSKPARNPARTVDPRSDRSRSAVPVGEDSFPSANPGRSRRARPPRGNRGAVALDPPVPRCWPASREDLRYRPAAGPGSPCICKVATQAGRDPTSHPAGVPRRPRPGS